MPTMHRRAAPASPAPSAPRSPRRLLTLALSIALCVLVSGLGAAASTARAEGDGAAAGGTLDVLVLKDGRRLEGTCVADGEEGVTFRANGSTRFYARDQIDRRETGTAPLPAAPAQAAPSSEPNREQTGGTSTPEGAPKPEAAKKAKAPKALTEESRAWVRELAGKATNPDETVRRSLAAALRACGPAAVPTIREVAATLSDVGGKAFLEGVATEMSAGKGERGPKGAPPAPGETPPLESEMGGGSTPGDGAKKPDAVGAGKRPDSGKGARGGMFEKLAQELELRDEQRQPFMAVLSAMERSRGQAVREIENGGTIEAGRAKVAEIRTTTIEGARGVLDAGQMEAFEIAAERFFGEMEMRLQKVVLKRGLTEKAPAGEPKQEPAPDAPPSPK